MHTVVPSLTHDKMYHEPLCFIASDQPLEVKRPVVRLRVGEQFDFPLLHFSVAYFRKTAQSKLQPHTW